MSKRILSSFRFGPVFGWIRRNTSSRRAQIKNVRQMYKNAGLTETGCKLCGGTDFTLLAESDRYGFDLKKQFCNTCGLVQTYPSLSDEFLQNFYAHHYRPLYTKASGPVDYAKLVIEQRAKGTRLLEYLGKSLPISLSDFHLIEIGCSSGGILAETRQHFKTVQGCDLDVDGTAYARSVLGLNVETREIPSKLPDGPTIFLMSHVLEHLNDPLKKLRTIRSIMKDSDFLVILVPGINAVKTGDYKHDLRRYFHIAHLSDFSAGTLSALGLLAGLDCICIDEQVNAIFKAGPTSTTLPTRNPKDSIENIQDIEKTYHNR